MTLATTVATGKQQAGKGPRTAKQRRRLREAIARPNPPRRATTDAHANRARR